MIVVVVAADADADHSTGKATLVLRDLFVAETLLHGGAALKALGALWTGRASANISRRLAKFLTQWKGGRTSQIHLRRHCWCRWLGISDLSKIRQVLLKLGMVPSII